MAEAETFETRLHEVEAELEAANAALGARGEPAGPTDPEELTVILDAAERGVTRIMERARRAYEEQIEQAEHVKREVRTEIARVGDWHRNIGPLIGSVQRSIEAARGEIVRVPDLIREALAPMTDAIGAVGDSLDQLASAPEPPEDGPAGGALAIGESVIQIDAQEEEPALEADGSAGDVAGRSEEQASGGGGGRRLQDPPPFRYLGSKSAP